MIRLSKAEWLQAATARYGSTELDWRFTCPACGFEQSVRDYADAGAPAGAVAYSCVGRWRPNSRRAFGQRGPGPCDYAGGGFFGLNPVEVVDEQGVVHCVMNFAVRPLTADSLAGSLVP